MNWNVITPSYTTASAGVEVMHKLIHMLNEAGENAGAVINSREGETIRLNPAYNYGKPMIDPDVIVVPDVFPEIPKSRFPNATTVRYCLYYPGGHGSGPTEYKEDVIFTYNNIKGEPYYPGAPEFHINTINRQLFCPGDRDRQGEAVYIGKGKPPESYLLDSHKFILTRGEPTIQHNLASILKTVYALRTFDRDTRLIEEAQACGTLVYRWDYDSGWWEKDHVPFIVPKPDTPIQVMIDAVKAVRG